MITDRAIQNKPVGHVFDTSRLELSYSGGLRISSLFWEYEGLHDISWTRETSAWSGLWLTFSTSWPSCSKHAQSTYPEWVAETRCTWYAAFLPPRYVVLPGTASHRSMWGSAWPDQLPHDCVPVATAYASQPNLPAHSLGCHLQDLPIQVNWSVKPFCNNNPPIL